MATPHALRTMIGRGLRRRCPVCGRGHLFSRWTRLVPHCPHCGTPLARREGDVYFASYGTMALITGLFLLIAVIVLLNQPFYQRYKPIIWTFLCTGLFTSILATARERKGIAVAIDCWLEGKRPQG